MNHDGPEGGPYADEVTAEEAATLLGISVRAVLKRLNKGSLRGRKIPTKFGEKWFADRNDLPSPVYVEVPEGGEQDRPEGGAAPEQGRTDPGTDFDQGSLQDRPGQNQVAQLMANALSNQSELIATVVKQAQIIELLTADLRQKDAQLKLLTDGQSQQKQAWWTNFCSWFMGQKQ